VKQYHDGVVKLHEHLAYVKSKYLPRISRHSRRRQRYCVNCLLKRWRSHINVSAVARTGRRCGRQ